MVRGGPANRAVKRAKIFALTKVEQFSVSARIEWLFSGLQGAQEELLQPRCACSPQGPAACLHWKEAQEERHEKGLLHFARL